MQKKRGSAILIAILLVTGIGTVAFSFGRILYLQVASASRYENGAGAYYAAESGLEEGFLRYRYDRSTQQPLMSGVATDWLTKPGNVDRYNLSDGKTIGDNSSGMVKTVAVSDLSKQYYDLRMGSSIGNISSNDSTDVDPAFITADYATSSDSPYYIPRDTTKKISLGDLYLGGDDLDLYFRSYPNMTGYTHSLAKKECTLVEVKLVGQIDGASSPEQYKAMLYNPSTNCDYARDLIKLDSTLGDQVNVKYNYLGSGDYSFKSVLRYAMGLGSFHYSNATLYLKPIGADIAYKTKDSAGLSDLHSGYTTLTSTGYYGGTARTLETKIDYQNGSLFDLYDYVIFSGS